MEINRRSALSAIGSFAALPYLLVKEKPFITKPGSELIPTGFVALDESLKGGLRRGHVYMLHGSSGIGKSALARSFALNASETHPVGYIPDSKQWLWNHHSAHDVRLFDKGEKKLFVFSPHLDPDLVFQQLEIIMDKVDFVVADNFIPSMLTKEKPPFKYKFAFEAIRRLYMIAQQTDTAVLVTRQIAPPGKGEPAVDDGNSLNYIPAGTFGLAKHEGRPFLYVGKNRWGIDHFRQYLKFNKTEWRFEPDGHWNLDGSPQHLAKKNHDIGVKEILNRYDWLRKTS